MGDEWSGGQFAGGTQRRMPSSSVRAYPAGDGQEIVLYVSPIAESEFDPGLLYAEIAADASRRAGTGQQIVSMTATPMRTKQLLVSIRETEVAAQFAVAVLYRKAG